MIESQESYSGLSHDLTGSIPLVEDVHLQFINTHYNLVKVRRDLFFFKRKILYPKLWLLQGS